LGCVAFLTETVGSDCLNTADDNGISYIHWGYKLYSNWTWDNEGHFKSNGWDTCSERSNFTFCLKENSV